MLMSATFVFQTCCNPLTWQISRILNCLLWVTGGVQQPTLAMINQAKLQRDSIGKALLGVRLLHGRNSVWYALQNVTRTLSSLMGMPWLSCDELQKVKSLSLALAEKLNKVAGTSRLVFQDTVLLKRTGDVEEEFGTLDLGVEPDTRIGNSMLTVRSESWPETCPKFCLFVLSELGDDNSEAQLHQLLKEAISSRNFYAEGSTRFSPSDWRALRKWLKALEKSSS
jgi:hypothetical protein